jgi:hypothetical protein
MTASTGSQDVETAKKAAPTRPTRVLTGRSTGS